MMAEGELVGDDEKNVCDDVMVGHTERCGCWPGLVPGIRSV